MQSSKTRLGGELIEQLFRHLGRQFKVAICEMRGRFNRLFKGFSNSFYVSLFRCSKAVV